MNFIDEAEIKIKAGKGGDGLASFRREKYVPKGGPDGGDGGHGGNVYFLVDRNLNTLSNFHAKKDFSAGNGKNGQKAKKTGKSADDLFLRVPKGTMIFEIKNDQKIFINDLTKDNQKLLIAQGGCGGRGNYHFATAVHQTPRFAEPGQAGEEKEILIELKLLADVGIIGLPNSGKSTLLSVITKAKPKIANYNFTTLMPNLGVANYREKEFVICDIPGLIEGASKGKGLGDKFLKHIERTKILIHLLDATRSDLEKDYDQIQKELEDWNPKLLEKKQIIVINKIDAIPNFSKIHQKFIKKYHPQAISAVAKKGIDELLLKIVDLLKNKK